MDLEHNILAVVEPALMPTEIEMYAAGEEEGGVFLVWPDDAENRRFLVAMSAPNHAYPVEERQAANM